MNSITTRRLAVISLFAFIACAVYQYLPAQQEQSGTKHGRFEGSYEVTVSDETAKIHLVSDVEVIEIGGEPFLSAKLVDGDAYREEYRGTACFLSIKQIASMVQLPEPKK